MNTLRLTPGAAENGLITFRLALWVGGKASAHWPVNSGQPDLQHLRTYADPRSSPGNYEPIPEAEYDLGPVEWAGGKDNWAASWGNGLGAVWIQIHEPGGGRGAFGIHLDANRAAAPGSAGCIVFRDQATMRDFLGFFSQHKPGALVVDYGLGTVPDAPALAAKPTPTKPKELLEVVGHSGKLRFRVGGAPWRELDSFKFLGDYRP